MTASPDYALVDRSGFAAQIFFPRPDFSEAPEGAHDLGIEVEPGVTLGARFYAFDREFPTILYFHGNGEVAGDHDDIAPFYRQAGANLFVVDFRGYGKSSGQPTFAALVSDGLPAARAFHELLDANGFSERRFVMGRSLGTQPALEVAAHAAGFAGLIVESGAGSLRRLASRLGGAGPEVEALVAAHEAKVRSIRLPALIIHGERDELVPLETAVELHELLEAVPRELIVIPGAGHNDILWVGYREYFAAVARFIAEPGAAAGRTA